MANKSETVNIHVQVAERQYPLKVQRGDEEKVQRAVKLVSDKLAEYQETFAGKDKQDYLAMCLLNFAVEYLNVEEQKQQNDRSLEEKLNQLEIALSGS
jgi:cell division protein ZapA (FtsZ GTPase activity inhibitor)